MGTEDVLRFVPLLCCCVVIVPFFVLIIFLVLKGRNQAWTGTIIDKNFNESSDIDSGDISTNYFVRIRKPEGKEFNLSVDRGKYDEYKVGDKLKKESGKLWPEKI